jgi:hypothetical protein
MAGTSTSYERPAGSVPPATPARAASVRAAEAVGEQAVRDALRPVLARFRDPETGAVTVRNTFRWVAASRP